MSLRSLTCVPLAACVLLLAVPAQAAQPKKYKNCAALNKVYPHGVGKPGARDKSQDERVTNFRVNRAVYNLNKGKDRDKDGIACEKL
ncbi:calcium-binding protein [Conexibacter sp. W3-3-2]|uniref:excalibur calcium-binding domain-containing protein n=1 Tax=Conexibacter sp. W3-3-2 TaxID=2675227 RepID=UPI0012B7BDC6|nr:calcium-binding protein [Conexibacter sp. W3-3-2]